MADRWNERTRFAGGLALATFAPLALAPLAAPSDGRGTEELLGVFVVVAYAGHVAVTAWLWSVRDVRHMVKKHPGRLILVPVGLIGAGAVVPFVASGRMFGWLLLGFFAWQFTHFQRQNVGLVAAMATQWNTAPPVARERRIIVVAGLCGTATLFARPTMLGVHRAALPAIAVDPVLLVAAAGWTACAIAELLGLFGSKRPGPVRIAHLTAVLFVAPLFLFTTPAAAVTGMVVAHGLQYLWVVGWRSHAFQRSGRNRLTGWRAASVIVALAVAGGSLLSAMSEVGPSGDAGFRLLFGAYLGIVMAHFSVDGVVWRRPSTTRSPAPPSLLPSPVLGGV